MTEKGLEPLLEQHPEIRDIREIDPNAHVLLWVGEDPHLPEDARENLRQALQPSLDVLFGILDRLPEDDDGFEGRGVYYTIGDRHIYVKGVGSHLSFADDGEPIVPELKKYRGFGKTLNNLFFDDPRFLASHPRVLGTETLRWAGLEYANSLIIFEQIVKKYGIETLDEARELGITIPLGVGLFPELSRLVEKSIRTLIEEETNCLTQNMMSWKGNFEGLGTIAMEVPSRTRLAGGIQTQEADEDAMREFLEGMLRPENYRTVARTLRHLLEMGFTYSFASAHSQNVYRSAGSVCAQADNSDLIHLGTLHELNSSNYMWTQETIPVRDQQAYLIYLQLTRDFVPPLLLGEGLDEFRQMKDECQVAFYEELFEGEVAQETITELVRLMPFFESEIKSAIAEWLHRKHSGERWEEVAERHTGLFDALPGVDMREQYDQKKENNIAGIDSYVPLNAIRAESINAFVRFLDTGDTSILEGIADLTDCKRFLEEIAHHPEHVQDAVLASILDINYAMEDNLHFQDKYDWASPQPTFWFANRTKVFGDIAAYLDEDREAGELYAQNLQTILTLFGKATSLWMFTEKFKEGIFNWEEILHYPERYGLKDGIKKQQFLYHASRFIWMNSGLANVIEGAFDSEKPECIHDIFQNNGLGRAQHHLAKYFGRVFLEASPEEFQRVHERFTEYVEVVSVTQREPTHESLAELDRIAQDFDEPILQIWHNWFLYTLYRRELKDEENAGPYYSKMMAGVEELEERAD